VRQQPMRIRDGNPPTQGSFRSTSGRVSRWLISLVIVLGIPVFFAAELSNSAYTLSSPASVLARLHERPSPLRWPAAHRGDHRDSHENSREAIHSAAQHGIPLIEVDVRRNASGTLFLFHDSRLDPGKVTAPAELMGRRVDSLDDGELGLVHYAGAMPASVATYAEALDAIRGQRTMLQLDVKGESTGVIDQAVGIARAKGQAHQILIQCQRLSTLSYVREKFPDVAVLARAHSPAEVRLAFRKLPDFIQIEVDWITRDMVEGIHAAGSKVLAKSLYEADTLEHWERLFDAGVDVVLTDRAVEMARHLSATSALRVAP